MPIWRSSELLTGRPGSPTRKASSARTSASKLRSGRSGPLPPLRCSDADGTAPDKHQDESTGHTIHYPSTQCTESGFHGVSTTSNWDIPQPALAWHGQPAVSAEEPPGSARSTLSRQTSRTDSRVGTGARANTYTVQYIGIANGELGILSQKQKLTIPITIPGASNCPVPASTAVLSRRISRASGSSSASTRGPTHVAASETTGGPTPIPAAAVLPTAPTVAAATPAAVSLPLAPPSRPTSSTRHSSAVPDPTVHGPILHPHDSATEVAAAAAVDVLSDETDDDSTADAQVKPSSLVNIVDDAYGQVKVITECFYSRALHSRAAPRDRHLRQNRPAGPLVQDMEPLSTALPGCFGHRAPSAGGFPGWKLTAPVNGPATVIPRRTYSGSESGFRRGRKQQRATSAQPTTGSAATTATATAADVPGAAAVAAAAVGSVSSLGSGRRTSDTSSWARGDRSFRKAGGAAAAAAAVASNSGEDAGYDRVVGALVAA